MNTHFKTPAHTDGCNHGGLRRRCHAMRHGPGRRQSLRVLAAVALCFCMSPTASAQGDPRNGAWFGRAVASDGNYVVVGAPRANIGSSWAGAVFVYNSTNWQLVAALNNPTPSYGDDFGVSVAISGTRVVVGSQERTGSTITGAAYVYDMSNANPTVPIVTLNNPRPGVHVFGAAVAIAGSRVVVGATGSDEAVYVYDVASASPTTAVTTLTNPTPTSYPIEYFGGSVAISGTRVIVGATGDDVGAQNAGSAYVFDLSGAQPNAPIATLNNPNPQEWGGFGGAVAISGTRVVVAAAGHDSPPAYDAGYAYVYDVAGATRSTPVAVLDNPFPAQNDNFGISVAISGTRVVVGDYAETVFVYDLAGSSQATLVKTLSNPSWDLHDNFGVAVAISGTRVIVGAMGDDTVALHAGAAYVFDTASTTPAVMLTQPVPTPTATPTPTPTPTVVPTQPRPSTGLANISTRAQIESGQNATIAGFIITGDAAKTVIIRGIGPSLTAHGVSGALSNPALTLHDASATVIGANDDWETTVIGGSVSEDQVTRILSSQVAPTHPNESAIIATLQPGAYTAILRGVNDVNGVGLVEIYDLSSGDVATLANISTRSVVTAQSDALIGGFIIGGIDEKKVAIRAIGPSLADSGVSNALADPTLALHNSGGEEIARNDNWQMTQTGGVVIENQVPEVQTIGLAPSRVTESVIIATLKPGAYTAVVRGANGTTGAALVEIYDLGPDEHASPAQINLLGVSQDAFNATSAVARFQITGDSFSLDPESVTILHNSSRVPPNRIQVTQHEIVVSPVFIDGRNDIVLLAHDSHSRGIYEEYTVWCGDNVLTGIVAGEAGEPVSGAQVSVALGDDEGVRAVATSAGGRVTFNNLPSRTLFVKATANPNRLASAAIHGTEATVELTLGGIKAASPVDNNDFSFGTDGWDVGTAPVDIIPHAEEALASPARGVVRSLNLIDAVQGNPMDLRLSTSGLGSQSISRTFTTKPGTKNVVIRYRFITTEVPAGFYDSEYNDFYNVSLRSHGGGNVVTEDRSMNSLRLSAFTDEGVTAWRSLSLPVSASGDIVQIDVSVANVGDDRYDSYVIIDYVEEQALELRVALYDADANLDVGPQPQLKYLSVDGTNGYFYANTRVHGTMIASGPMDDELQSVVLEVIQGGVVKATAALADLAREGVIKPFGPTGTIERLSNELLFQLPSSEAANVDGTEDGTLSLRARATSKKGRTATAELPPVELLVRYTKQNRFGGRDTNHGGDDWATPTVRDIASGYQGLLWNDFSKMNGGRFHPHKAHRKGVDCDGTFGNYANRDAATAQAIIGHLNHPEYGSKISLVGVEYQTTGPNTAFFDAIKNVTVSGNRRAQDVIRPWAGHTTHFHWRIERASE